MLCIAHQTSHMTVLTVMSLQIGGMHVTEPFSGLVPRPAERSRGPGCAPVLARWSHRTDGTHQGESVLRLPAEQLRQVLRTNQMPLSRRLEGGTAMDRSITQLAKDVMQPLPTRILRARVVHRVHRGRQGRGTLRGGLLLRLEQGSVAGVQQIVVEGGLHRDVVEHDAEVTCPPVLGDLRACSASSGVHPSSTGSGSSDAPTK